MLPLNELDNSKRPRTIPVLLGFVLLGLDLISGEMSLHFVEVGDSLSLTCTKSGSIIFWDRADTEAGAIAIDGTMQVDSDHITLTVSDDGTQTLTLHDVTLEDEAVYQCYIPFPQVYSRYNVTIIKQPSELYVSLPPEIYEDTTVTISCTTGYAKPPPDLQLGLQYNNGTIIPIDTVISDETHTDNTVTRTAAATLQFSRGQHRSRVVCQATSDILGYNETDQMVLNMRLPPLSVRLVSPEIAQEGDLVTFSCRSHGAAPPADVTWYRDGKLVAEVDSVTMPSGDGTWETRSDLVELLSADDNDAILECEATNEALQHTGSQALRDTAVINVHYSPRVSTDSATVLVGWEGRCKTIGCTVTANPEANITWYHDNHSIALTDRHEVASDSTRPSLTICDLEREDEGHYVCEATNDLGSDGSMPVFMQVQYDPSCWPSQPFRYGAGVGDTVTLSCWVQAFPSGTIFFGWNVNGTWTQVDGVWVDHYQDIAYSSLNYTVSSDAHYIDITCKGINGVGFMQDPCVFNILPPSAAEPPTLCEMERRYYNRIEVACIGAYDGGSDILYIAQVLTDDEFQDVLNSTDATLEIGNLTPMSSYSYRVCVTNALFPDILNCSEPFNMSTTADPHDMSGMADPNPNLEQLYLIALPVLGVLCTVFIITIAMVESKRKKEDRKRRNPSIASVAAPPKPPRAPEVPPFRQLSDPNALGLNKPPKRPSLEADIPEVSGNPAFVTNPEDPWYDVAGGAYLNGSYVMASGENLGPTGHPGPRSEVLMTDRTYMCLEDPRMMVAEEDPPRYREPPPPPPDRPENHDAKTEPRPSRHVRNDSQGSISSLPNSRPQTPNKLADIPEHEDEHSSPEEHYTHIPFPTQPANREELSLSVDGLPELPRRNSSGRRKRQGALPKVPEEHNNGGVMTSDNNVISGGNQYT